MPVSAAIGGGNLVIVLASLCWRHVQILVMNEQGYGHEIVLPAGLDFTHALRWQFTGDNQAPPTADQVEACAAGRATAAAPGVVDSRPLSPCWCPQAACECA